MNLKHKLLCVILRGTPRAPLYPEFEKMIRVVYWKAKKVCALCQEDIVRRTAAMYDPTKSAAKRFVHLKCWTDLQEKRGIKLEEPPF